MTFMEIRALYNYIKKQGDNFRLDTFLLIIDTRDYLMTNSCKNMKVICSCILVDSF